MTDQHPGKPVRSERASLRARTLDRMRAAVGLLQIEAKRWRVGATIVDGSEYFPVPGHPTNPIHPGPDYRQRWRWRRWDEYPENDPDRCRESANELRFVARGLIDLADEIDRVAESATEAHARRQKGT